MKKYRVIQFGEAYYPQYSWRWWRWAYYKELRGWDLYEIVVFRTLKEAQEYIKKHKRVTHD